MLVQRVESGRARHCQFLFLLGQRIVLTPNGPLTRGSAKRYFHRVFSASSFPIMAEQCKGLLSLNQSPMSRLIVLVSSLPR